MENEISLDSHSLPPSGNFHSLYVYLSFVSYFDSFPKSATDTHLGLELTRTIMEQRRARARRVLMLSSEKYESVRVHELLYPTLLIL